MINIKAQYKNIKNAIKITCIVKIKLLEYKKVSDWFWVK